MPAQPEQLSAEEMAADLSPSKSVFSISFVILLHADALVSMLLRLSASDPVPRLVAEMRVIIHSSLPTQPSHARPTSPPNIPSSLPRPAFPACACLSSAPLLATFLPPDPVTVSPFLPPDPVTVSPSNRNGCFSHTHPHPHTHPTGTTKRL